MMAKLAETLDNPRVRLGANNPPSSPFDTIKIHIDDLWLEATNWCDGAPIENQAQADEVARLLDGFRKAAQTADAARREENKPFDDAKAEVQARYAELIGDTKARKGLCVLAVEALKGALQPWLLKLDQERRAEAEAARIEAERAAQAARQAAQDAMPGDLEDRREVEQAHAAVKAAEAEYADAAAAKAHANGGDRATTLRSYWTPVLTNPTEALRHYMIERPDELKAFLLELARRDVAGGKRQLPGFEVVEERRVV